MDVKHKIEIRGRESTARLKMPWKNCISVGRAYDLMRQDLFNHLKFLQDTIGYRYCRFHAIFDDDMGVVTRATDGKLVFSWHQVDKVYDSLLRIGLKPFVELNPMPQALASGSQTMFHYKMNVTPPASYDEWGWLVREFTKHLVGRYGLEEVRQWFFEVWNEPNLPAFFSGSKEDYFRLYEVSAQNIRAIDPQLKVGGPATSKGSWISEFIEYCNSNNVPLDFVSTHLYPQDEFVTYKNKVESPHGPGKFFQDIVRSVSQAVKNSSMPGLPVHWTEWNTQSAINSDSVTWLDNIYVDNIYAAACIIENCYQLDNECETFCYWIASDIFFESGLKHSPFSCTYGMLNIHGIPKASYNAFFLLNKMTGDILETSSSQKLPDGCNTIAVSEAGTIKVLLWNHQAIEQGPANKPWEGVIEIPAHADKLIISCKITINGGSAWEAWQQMGAPGNITPMQEEFLYYRSKPIWHCQLMQKENNDLLHIPFILNNNEVTFMEIAPAQKSITSPYQNVDNKLYLNTGMGKLDKE